MRAFVVTKYKEPLQEADVPEPTSESTTCSSRCRPPGSTSSTRRSARASSSRSCPYKLPLILGNDVAGTVIRVGAKVRGFKPGDEVYARPDKDRIGTFAERIAVAEADLALKPASISMEEAASLPLVALTAWQALVERGNVQPGQKVLIHAGAGGVGSIAIQLAKHLGATVATTASAANADFVRGARRGHRHRLPHPGLRAAPRRLRPGARQPRRENLEKSLRVLRARRQGDRHRRPARPGLRPRGRPEPGAAPGDRRPQQQASAARPRSSA